MRFMFRFNSLTAVVIIGLLTAATAATGATGSGRPAVRVTTITTWVQRYDGGQQPGPMAVSRDGSKLFVTGILQKPGAATIAYNAVTGAALWHAPYPGGSADALAVSPDGSTLFVTGGAGTVAYDTATGAVLWTNAGAPGSSIAVSPDGSTVFAASWNGQLPGYVVGAYTTASGASVWTSSYRRTGLTAGAYVTVSPDGTRVFVLGTSGDFGAYLTIAYDASTGARLWIRHYTGPAGSVDVLISFAVSPDGTRLFVTGDNSPPGTANGDFDYVTLAYNTATGAPLWTRRYNGPAKGDDEPNSVAVSPDGSTVYVTGQSIGAGGPYNYATVAYAAASGATRWVRRYRGPGGAGGAAIFVGVSPDASTVFVTGAAGSGLDDYATLGYDAATGAQLWVRLYKGPKGFNSATGGAVSPARPQVFVTGTSVGINGNQDYATVSYTQG
jgi:PQQ-like domain